MINGRLVAGITFIISINLSVSILKAGFEESRVANEGISRVESIAYGSNGDSPQSSDGRDYFRVATNQALHRAREELQGRQELLEYSDFKKRGALAGVSVSTLGLVYLMYRREPSYDLIEEID